MNNNAVQADSEEELQGYLKAYDGSGCFTALFLSLSIWAPMAWVAGWF